ncbi:antA/AntB antirepressor family protein [Acinetobacter junii]|jgi:phage anti-repressor protein|uniref:antA/AntB antirepressor family protein n=1 Tax=Acinetobacter junii TaxID=40215 RepID=UPI00244A0085|nr:antA/AntB antirepressor family protein [Acinetobacter junii]MDH0718230.1 antA/AntB antirepressor family protein [Acinetobacter junii]
MNIANNPIQFSNVVLGNEQQLGVNARDVHAALEVKTDFSDWMKRRIKQCKFEENYDYMLILKKEEQVSGAKYLNEYIISIDMAKHLGMMERNNKGHEIRKYFIEQEKIARSVTHNLQIEIGKAMQYLEQFSNSLSDAGRLLCVGGKQIKPKLLKELDELVGQVQPCLNSYDGKNILE